MTDQLWKTKFAAKSLNQNFSAKLTGITHRPGLDLVGRMLPVFTGIMIGAFITITILRPDLINWETFSRSFMLGIIIGMR